MIRDGHYFYDVRENLLRHTDCVLFFAVGVRRAGKTYSCTDMVGKAAVEKGQQFIWLRTLETETELTANEGWFKQLSEKYPNKEFKIKRKNKIKTLFIDDIPMGYFMSIRQWERIKGVKFNGVGYIIYDEFLSQTIRREKNFDQVTALQGLVHTVNERRQGTESVRCVCLANQISYNNNFFKKFGVEIPQGTKGIYKLKEKHIAVELVYDEAYVAEQKETEWGQIFMTNEYGEHALENKALVIKDGFIIDKKPPNLHLMFTLRYFNSYINVYDDLDEKIYIDESKTLTGTSRIQVLGLTYADSEKYEIPWINKYCSSRYKVFLQTAINNNNISYVGRDVKEIVLQNL